MNQEAFFYLTSFPENDICFECGEEPIVFSSVNNGIMLCDRCGELHKQLPPPVSTVKSIHDEHWTPDELDLVLNGGNSKIYEVFAHYNVPRNANFDYKYKTQIGCYYRFMLRAIVNGNDSGAPPQQEKALLFGTEQEKAVEGEIPSELQKIMGFHSKSSTDITKKTIKDVLRDPHDWQHKTKESVAEATKLLGSKISEVEEEAKTFLNKAKKEGHHTKGLTTFVKTLAKKHVHGHLHKNHIVEGSIIEETSPIDKLYIQKVSPFQQDGILINESASLLQQYPGQVSGQQLQETDLNTLNDSNQTHIVASQIYQGQFYFPPNL